MVQLVIGALVGGGIAAWAIKWDLALATHERARAEKLLRQADGMLAAAEAKAVRADALTTPTGEMAIVQPLKVRVRLAGRSAAEWARETFAAPTGPAWAQFELDSLRPAAKAPLRSRGVLAEERRTWPLMPRLLPPSPLLDAAPYSFGGSR